MIMWIQGSPMLVPARKYLTLRALGSPAVAVSLAMQGVFRGFKDTKTPLYATGKYIWNKDLERKNNNDDDVFVIKQLLEIQQT